jgi:antitoxin ParD1/3/4
VGSVVFLQQGADVVAISTASEVIREALGNEANEDLRAANLAALKTDIAQGVADMASGQFGVVDVDLKIRGRAMLAARVAGSF